jgi:AcrR family transcriptional regulator
MTVTSSEQSSPPSAVAQGTSASPSAFADRSPDASPRRSARERGREATRARLLESGRALFAERGLHGVTTHDIAHRAEVAAGTFYLHFSDKQTLFREIVDEKFEELLRRLERASAPLDDLREMSLAQSDAMFRFAEENREMIRMLFSADNDAAAVGSDILDRLANTIAQSRRERLAAGRAPAGLDPAVVGQAIVGMWARVLAWWSEDPSRVSREELLDTLKQIQLSGTHPESSGESTDNQPGHSSSDLK